VGKSGIAAEGVHDGDPAAVSRLHYIATLQGFGCFLPPPQFSALIRRGVAVILLLLCIKGFEVIAKTPFLGP
jgi:hypothetical protein